MKLQTTSSLLALAFVLPLCLAKPQGHARRQFQSATLNSRSANPNVGNPWGSNIFEVTADSVSDYPYTATFTGQNTEPWTIVFWNTYGPNGLMDGWYGYSALTLTLDAGETKYVVFDANSEGGWAAAAGSTIPTDFYGGYSATWGEFDFGNSQNQGWSGFDVSAIQPQAAGQTVQGMQICLEGGGACSAVSGDGSVVQNAYTDGLAAVGGIGGNVPAGPVHLDVVIDYQA